jgi:hypothetical protein
MHSTVTFQHPFAQLPTDQNFSSEVNFVQVIDSPILSPRVDPSISRSLSSHDNFLLQLLEVFTFGRRPRSNGFESNLTPTARAFQLVYNSEERQVLPVTIGICCLSCKRSVGRCGVQPQVHSFQPPSSPFFSR